MFLLPVGPDRADGKTQLPAQPQGAVGAGTLGSPTPDGARMVQSQQGQGTEVTIEERPDGTEIERAEQATFRKRLVMSYPAAVGLLGVMGRGTFLADSGTSAFGTQTIWRVLSSNLRSLKGDLAELSYSAESISFDSPPDDFDIETVDLGLDLLKHPRYAGNLLPFDSDYNTTYKIVGDSARVTFANVKNTLVRMIQTYRDSPIYPSAAQINGMIHSIIADMVTKDANGKTHIDCQVPNASFDPSQPVSPANTDGSYKPLHWSGLAADIASFGTINAPFFIVSAPVDLSNDLDPVNIAIAAACEIITKLWRNEDTPPIPGYEVRWDQYFFKPVYLDGGGYIQDPFGVVPDYFTDPNQDGSSSIFAKLAQINPQLFSSDGTATGAVNISWLRMADRISYQRTWFKVSRVWRGSPIGTWDADLFNTNPRPSRASDYHPLFS